MFLGVSADDPDEAVFLVDSTVTQAGEGRCRPSAATCSFLYLTTRDGRDEHIFTTDDGKEYAIKLLEIRRVQVKSAAQSFAKDPVAKAGSATTRDHARPLAPPIRPPAEPVTSVEETAEQIEDPFDGLRLPALRGRGGVTLKMRARLPKRVSMPRRSDLPRARARRAARGCAAAPGRQEGRAGPTVSSFSPTKPELGGKLTLFGKGFAKKRRSNTVVLRAPNGGLDLPQAEQGSRRASWWCACARTIERLMRKKTGKTAGHALPRARARRQEVRSLDQEEALAA